MRLIKSNQPVYTNGVRLLIEEVQSSRKIKKLKKKMEVVSKLIEKDKSDTILTGNIFAMGVYLTITLFHLGLTNHFKKKFTHSLIKFLKGALQEI